MSVRISSGISKRTYSVLSGRQDVHKTSCGTRKWGSAGASASPGQVTTAGGPASLAARDRMRDHSFSPHPGAPVVPSARARLLPKRTAGAVEDLRARDLPRASEGRCRVERPFHGEARRYGVRDCCCAARARRRSATERRRQIRHVTRRSSPVTSSTISPPFGRRVIARRPHLVRVSGLSLFVST